MKLEWQLLTIAIGGGLGALSRFGLYLWLNHPQQPGFGWGTLAANAIGCLAAGFIIGCGATERHEWIRLGVGVGYLGALTTFSTFGIETANHLRENQLGLAGINISANLVVGIGMVLLGVWSGRLLRG